MAKFEKIEISYKGSTFVVYGKDQLDVLDVAIECLIDERSKAQTKEKV